MHKWLVRTEDVLCSASFSSRELFFTFYLLGASVCIIIFISQKRSTNGSCRGTDNKHPGLHRPHNSTLWHETEADMRSGHVCCCGRFSMAFVCGGGDFREMLRSWEFPMEKNCWDWVPPSYLPSKFENTARSKEVPSRHHWRGLGLPSLWTLRNKSERFINYPGSVIATEVRLTQQDSNKTFPAQVQNSGLLLSHPTGSPLPTKSVAKSSRTQNLQNPHLEGYLSTFSSSS